MAKPADVTDPTVQALLLEAEADVDTKNYDGAVRKCMAAYSHLIDIRPDVIVPPGSRAGAAPSFDRVLRAMPARPWPDVCGVDLLWKEGDKPRLVAGKDRFTLSDAVTYLEYTLDTAMRAQRG
ncbi:MAG: hypothetical protein ACRDGF_03280 [Chloroflexota bacterium]